MVEEEESEFSHFEDDEEFENYRQVRFYGALKGCLNIKIAHAKKIRY